MDVHPKFIIEGDALIIQKATYHRDIATDPKQVKGGGWFFYSQKTNTFTFSEQSEEFGKAKLEDIAKCVEAGNVFEGRGRRRNISLRHKFAYNTGSKVIPLIRPVHLRALTLGDKFIFEDHFSDNPNEVLEDRQPGVDLVKVRKPSGGLDYYDCETMVKLKIETDGEN